MLQRADGVALEELGAGSQADGVADGSDEEGGVVGEEGERFGGGGGGRVREEVEEGGDGCEGGGEVRGGTEDSVVS